MLQDIRANAQGTAAKIIVGLIVMAFALFGIESILLGGGGSGVAEVNGEEISPRELQQAVNNQKRQLISMMGDNIDPAMLDDQRLSAQAMQTLIQRKLMVQSADAMGMAVSDRQLGVIIGSMEQFQMDGQFSPEIYRVTLADAGFTPTSFKETLAQDMLIGQARAGLSGSEFSTPAELALNARIAAEQRDIRYLTLPLANFAVEQDVTEADIAAYYEANGTDFLSQEAVELDYIELRTADFREPVDESQLQDAYQAELQGAEYQTESQVSHILFERGSDESEDELNARVAIVTEKLAAGEDFAALATEFSDDIGSKNFGGELGYTSGDAFPSQMETAIAELEVGQVSAAVETEAGIHIIKVTDRRSGEPPSFEEMRAELEDRVAMAEAQVELIRTVETLKDLAFNAEDLGNPAEELSLTVAGSDRISRAQDQGLFANPALLAAAFSDDVLNAGHNSDVIELSSEHWVVLRVREHHPSEVRPLEEVQSQIQAQIADQRAREAVTAAAEQAVLALRGGASVETLANEAGYEWQVELGADRRNLAIPREVLQSAFALAPPAEGATVVDYVLNSMGDAQVFQLDRVTPGTLDVLPDADQVSLRQIVVNEYRQVVDAEYRQGLRDAADITVL